MVDYSDIRELRPKEKVFFMYSCGVHKGFRNLQWAKNNWRITHLDVYVADPINYIGTVPVVIVSANMFTSLRDPHITEKNWRKIEEEELAKLYERYCKRVKCNG